MAKVKVRAVGSLFRVMNWGWTGAAVSKLWLCVCARARVCACVIGGIGYMAPAAVGVGDDEGVQKSRFVRLISCNNRCTKVKVVGRAHRKR